MPYRFSRSSLKFQGHTAKKIVEFDPNWAFPDCNSSFNTPIDSRISSILPPGATPKRIILQVAVRYDALINSIKIRCPQAQIILSKVPPRRGTPRTMSSINEINRRIDAFSDKIHNVFSIDVCPSALYHFNKDCPHFNAAGLKYYANGIGNVLRNFHRQQQTPNL